MSGPVRIFTSAVEKAGSACADAMPNVARAAITTRIRGIILVGTPGGQLINAMRLEQLQAKPRPALLSLPLWPRQNSFPSNVPSVSGSVDLKPATCGCACVRVIVGALLEFACFQTASQSTSGASRTFWRTQQHAA